MSRPLFFEPLPSSPAPLPRPARASGPVFPVVAVVGLGVMGAGIAEVVARSGRRVVGVERDAAAADAARQRIELATAEAVARGRYAEAERRALLARITVTPDLAEAATCGAGLVIEVVPEELALKCALITELDRLCGPETVLATGATALSLTQIASAAARPDRVLGLHFFNPAPAMRLVEVVRTALTDDQAVADAAGFARALGKSPVMVEDRAGFVVNGLLFAYLNQAAAMAESRYASRDDIDAAMRLGCGLPMGPLALLDLIGIDTALTVLEAMYARSGDRMHAPAPVLGQLAAAGLLGRKTGRGFYRYAAPGSAETVADPSGPFARGPFDEPADPPSAADHPSAPRPAPVPAVRPVATAGVYGSGARAAGVAETLALGGRPVVLVGEDAEDAARTRAAVAASLARAVADGVLTPARRDAALALVAASGELSDLAGADLVVEAAAEELAVKQRVFAALDRVCRPGAVLATATSAVPVVRCAAATSRPADVVGLHFLDPAPSARVVEVVRTVLTSPGTAATVRQLCRELGRHPVQCGDRAGFVVNALLLPYLNEAVRLLEDHHASMDDADTAMRLGCNYPMGPFELLDAMGLDVSLALEQVLHREFREPGLAPAPLWEHLVAAGCLGRKSGRGFRDYALAE